MWFNNIDIDEKDYYNNNNDNTSLKWEFFWHRDPCTIKVTVQFRRSINGNSLKVLKRMRSDQEYNFEYVTY